MEMNETITCPDCGEEIELKPKEGNPKRLVAMHNCQGRGLRCVFETDAPAYPPSDLIDRLEQSEHTPVKRR
jgi:hypothetical protein